MKMKQYMVIASSVAMLAGADQACANDDGRWLMSLNFGDFKNDSYLDVADDSVVPANLLESDGSDSGFGLDVGYLFDDGLFATLGYLDQGKASSEWGGEVRDAERFAAYVAGLTPTLGKGFVLKGGYHLALTDAVYLSGYVGAFAYQQNIAVAIETPQGMSEREVKKDGSAALIGAGLGIKVTKALSFEVNAERYDMDVDDASGIRASVIYHF